MASGNLVVDKTTTDAQNDAKGEDECHDMTILDAHGISHESYSFVMLFNIIIAF